MFKIAESVLQEKPKGKNFLINFVINNIPMSVAHRRAVDPHNRKDLQDEMTPTREKVPRYALRLY